MMATAFQVAAFNDFNTVLAMLKITDGMAIVFLGVPASQNAIQTSARSMGDTEDSSSSNTLFFCCSLLQLVCQCLVLFESKRQY